MTGNKLVIVESPTKARKIGGYLGGGYTVMASVGHIRDLAQPSQIPAEDKAKYGKFGVDVDDGFLPYYVVGKDKKKTVSDLKKALKTADELYLATDEDREGEAIAWHLVQTLKPKVPVKRMVFHEITKNAIAASLGKTRQVDDNMVDAQETRRVLDRLYGYELSPVLWRKVGPGLSAGRVQSVATRLIVQRERERMAFVRTAYWDIVATVALGGGVGVNAQGQKVTGDEAVDTSFKSRLISVGGRRVTTSKDFDAQGQPTPTMVKDQALALNQADADRICQAIAGQDFTVMSLETKPYRRRPVPPFTTSTMQQAAGNRLGMSSRAAMRAAQGLYENGYITYMRTDSVTLSSEAIAAAREEVEKKWGGSYLSEKPKQYATTSAGAQEAHECIRPAGAHFRSPESLEGKVPPDQLKLYRLIWQRTLASQMADATGSTATVKLSAAAGLDGEVVFQSSGTVIDFLGFLRAYGEGRGTGSSRSSKSDSADSASSSDRNDDEVLPAMSVGDVLRAIHVDPAGHETQPPARYTEASLVKTLEAKEIGRPSTYASIISTIIDRGYVYERGRALIPSWLAFAVIKLLEQNFPQYVDYAFTARMENGLDQIAQGKESGKQWLSDFYFGSGKEAARDAQEAHEGLHDQVAQLGEIDARMINTIEIGDGLQVRVGRYGPYLEDTKNLDSDGKPKRASIPDTIAPDELTVDVGHDLIEHNSAGPRVLGTDPDTGGEVEVRSGRFGPYVALVIEGQDKPKMASLFKTMDPESVSLNQALRLLSLPRLVGTVEETNQETGEISQVEILANNGRYGPYLTKTGADGKSETRSLASEDEIFTVDLAKAQELYAQPKYGRRTRAAAKPPLRELGADPETGKTVTIKDGFYGVYITDGETNRTLPKQYTAESIEPAEAFRLLAEKRAAGPSKRRIRRGTRKTATAAKKTSTTKKSAPVSKAKAA
ncbi:MAG: type I DNA topoisomerase [Parascardovia denticolens]